MTSLANKSQQNHYQRDTAQQVQPMPKTTSSSFSAPTHEHPSSSARTRVYLSPPQESALHSFPNALSQLLRVCDGKVVTIVTDRALRPPQPLSEALSAMYPPPLRKSQRHCWLNNINNDDTVNGRGRKRNCKCPTKDVCCCRATDENNDNRRRRVSDDSLNVFHKATAVMLSANNTTSVTSCIDILGEALLLTGDSASSVFLSDDDDDDDNDNVEIE